MKNNAPHLLSNLPAYGKDGSVHAVVEAPKGSLVKLKYEIKLGVFTVAHSLPVGLSYPFDWGFVPSTQAPDGLFSIVSSMPTAATAIIAEPS
jgi:inorganic pyrophosphatase